MAEQGVATTLEDNERVRITEWRMPPGSTTGWHRHGLDYVVVPLTDGRLRLLGPDGQATITELSAGGAYFRRAGVEHETFNASEGIFRFIEVEIKSHQG
jgi:quercetin dioxygenase-like cupin family protein